MIVKFQNNLDKSEYIFDNLEDLKSSRLYYVFDITLPEGCPDGEYTYSLIDDNDKVLATGLCIIGDYTPANNKTYAKEQNGYVQYNSNN